ncbi:LysM peptidoglycan-binding domain-containing protein [Pontibacter sp. FD36]|uniref:LysM domain-containing protein n=1 Tax=Pontibacter lucknowensis TaxID=1077936 RepID=A0A1N6U0N5_9BACT|nr:MULTISPECIES: LysM peptidoglycan-binding domain-containing protein [Pontibacter]EJF10657.1 LysM domain-containing protein [Pontibacter sp. BAB1700]MBF8964863.1 LysM peptidoglycan-binding domain-containing protein [Pontibacter sp. FD36]SIQ59198.1 LysM domain-containing protein [Pontibacter lucknowensis]
MGLRDFFKKGEQEPAKKSSDQVNKVPGQSEDHKFFTNKDEQQVTDPSANQDVYTVQSGDSLSKIAKKLYGDANAWNRIYEANKDTIGGNPDLIRPGQRFKIPRT